MRFFISLLCLVFLVIACNSATDSVDGGGGKSGGENMAGGPCSYKTDSTIAEVIKINKIDTNSYDILFVLRNKSAFNIAPDTLHYANELHGLLTGEEIKAKDIKIGDHYRYFVSSIINGSCTPHITQLNMTKVK
jgi:hypothetical protein